jgi:hypothetical protein
MVFATLRGLVLLNNELSSAWPKSANFKVPIVEPENIAWIYIAMSSILLRVAFVLSFTFVNIS